MLKIADRSTRLERWLATHIGFFARRWYRRAHAELVEQAQQSLELSRACVTVAAQRVVAALNGPRERELLDHLVRAVVDERNALMQYIELTSGKEARDVAGRALIEADAAVNRLLDGRLR